MDTFHVPERERIDYDPIVQWELPPARKLALIGILAIAAWVVVIGIGIGSWQLINVMIL